MLDIINDCQRIFLTLKTEYIFFKFSTGGFICGEDSLARSDDPMSNITELLLLLRSEEGVRVRHPDSIWETKDETIRKYLAG